MKIIALNLYPVKSMRGIALQHAQIGMAGFVGDREWLLADAQGQCITARTVPHLLLWQPELTARGIRLCTPNGASLEVHSEHYTQAVSVTVWQDHFQAYSGPAQTDAWLSQHLGRPCRLLHLGSAPQRSLAVNGGGALSFADGAPYLLTSEASLAALNGALERPVGMARFRPNIVVDGHAPYAEDSWTDITVGGVALRGYKPCGRCKMVNLDPATAQLSADKEPLKTLAKTHQLAQGACFGMNAYAHQTGRVQIGDEVVGVSSSCAEKSGTTG